MSELHRDRELLDEVKAKSEDAFEKNILYISAGTLALTITFLEKIVNVSKAVNINLLGWAWGLLAFTLLLNLLSHLFSSWVARTMAARHSDQINGRITFPEYLKIFRRQNFKIDTFNVTSVISLIAGIFCLICFCIQNAKHMSDIHKEDDRDSIHRSTENFPRRDDDLMRKGRTLDFPTEPEPKPNSNDTLGNDRKGN